MSFTFDRMFPRLRRRSNPVRITCLSILLTLRLSTWLRVMRFDCKLGCPGPPQPFRAVESKWKFPGFPERDTVSSRAVRWSARRAVINLRPKRSSRFCSMDFTRWLKAENGWWVNINRNLDRQWCV
jgi:hypothetical protein